MDGSQMGGAQAREWRVPGFAEEAELGRGGSGRVVSAVEQATGRRVAVKYLAARLASDEQFRAAFRAEAQILAGLDLPNVVKVRRYADSVDGAAIIMDLADGVSLRAILAAHGAAGPKAALSVLTGSLTGLAGAHAAGIVHRDYKPENVIVDSSGTSMLVDFGIAARTGQPGRPAGTPGYAAPEQWAGAPASPSGDIYAAAVTFAECAAGTIPPAGPQPPGPGASAPPAPPGLGPRLTALIERATSPDPAARPADAAALLAELQDAADDRYGPGWDEQGRAELAIAVAALATAALAGGAAGVAAGGTAAATGSAAPGIVPAAAAGATTLGRTARRAGRLRAGHGPVLITAVAAGTVIVAGAAIAIAVTGHHHTIGGGGGPAPSGRTTASTGPGRPHASPSPSGTTSAVAVNAADPCTWLTPADFARYGIAAPQLHPGSFPGGWRACRSGHYYVGVRSAFLRGCPPTLGLFHCTPVSVAGAVAAQYLVLSRPAVAELHAVRAGLQYSIGVPTGAAGRAALIRLMELLLTRIAAA